MSSTLELELAKNKGIGPGFDFVRIGLAALILFGHCFWVAGKADFIPVISNAAEHFSQHNVRYVPLVFSGQTYLKFMLVPMFFAVSGFLVTGSAFRTNSLRVFLAYRILRIVPALFTEVTLSALFLGPLLTTVALREYLTDPHFFEYFGNIIGRVRMLLPGVFLNNPSTLAVNVNLWTLPPEFYCYLIIAALLAVGLLTHRKAFTIIFSVATAWLIAGNIRTVLDGQHVEVLSSTLVVYYFFVGCLLFHWREYVPFHPALFVVFSIAAFALYFYRMPFVAPIFVSYAVIYVGMIRIPRLPLIQSGDYSYGVYLYGFPIAQAVVCILPQLRGHGWLLFGIVAPAVVSFAAVSWHFIEKPTLALKRTVSMNLQWLDFGMASGELRPDARDMPHTRRKI